MRHNKVYLPYSNAVLNIHSNKHFKGKGVGSVLLSNGMGTGGVGSSYSSINDYITTTNQNPYYNQPKGMGIGHLSHKLDSLNINKKKKERNINFNL
jgi:hypothetical protein